MNENECEGIACKFSALDSINLSYFHPFFLKGWAKVSQVLILRNFGLDLWHRGGVSYFDKCRSSLRTASVPLLSWIKGVVAFQWPERSHNYILVIANPSLCLRLWLKLCACDARHLSPKKQLLWFSLFVPLISCFHTSVCEICWTITLAAKLISISKSRTITWRAVA